MGVCITKTVNEQFECVGAPVYSCSYLCMDVRACVCQCVSVNVKPGCLSAPQDLEPCGAVCVGPFRRGSVSLALCEGCSSSPALLC